MFWHSKRLRARTDPRILGKKQMTTNEINRVQITDKLAVSVEYDSTHYTLEELAGDAEFWGVFWIPNRFEKLDTKNNIGPITEELAQTYRHAGEYLDGEDLETALIKRATRAGYVARTKCFSDYNYWRTAVYYAQDTEWLDGIRDEINTWFTGEIYTLTAYELTTWTNAKLETRETWDELETYTGITTGLNVYEPEQLKLLAAEHFSHLIPIIEPEGIKK